MATGDVFQAPWASPSIAWMDGDVSHSAKFAFWSITGGSNGASFSTQNTPPPTNVGNADIIATAWYIAGDGPGEPGIFIDAFDVNQGIFVDDDFVSVTPDNALTAAANNDGFVPTASIENIDAYASIHNAPFQNWTVVEGSETVNAKDLQAAANSFAIAFAFYIGGSGKVPPTGNYEAGAWVSWGVIVDGGGPTGAGPVPPWNPYLQRFAAGLALAEAVHKVSMKLRPNLLEIAAQQIALAADAIVYEMRVAKKEAIQANKKRR
jgi:hypothetical protein